MRGKVSENDEPGWVMATISKTVQDRMEHFRKTQMMLDNLTQPGCGDGPTTSVRGIRITGQLN